ncbi:hypothetical protein CP532_1396 [Ophiocordyceps camponoti-leonardi (nom. inval.)]|nr:hypothetical protein CP532_1396 [Ophiocordyceps camponoti-leonardi (nom. inval.)]
MREAVAPAVALAGYVADHRPLEDGNRDEFVPPILRKRAKLLQELIQSRKDAPRYNWLAGFFWCHLDADNMDGEEDTESDTSD